MTNMTPDDAINAFLYGCSELDVTEDGVAPDMDPEHLQTMGALSVLIYRLVVAEESPWQMALARLAVLTGALLVSSELGSGPEIVAKWQAAKSEAFELARLAAS
jgi:hypothetical protein